LELWIIALIGFVAFWLAINMAKRYFPKSLSLPFPIILMWRTSRFNNFIDLLARSGKSIWKAVWDVGIAVSIGGMIYIFYFLAQNLYNLILYFITKNQGSASPVSLLIPGVTLSLDLSTLVYVGISIGLIIIFHELSHGIASRAEGLKVKSTGLVLAAIIPGAFVEPDEEDLKKAKKSTQARVYAAGSATNIWMAVVVVALLANVPAILSPFYQSTPAGALVLGTVQGSPASGVLVPGDVIVSLNGSSVKSEQTLSQILTVTKPNSTVPMVILHDGLKEQIEFTLGYSTATNISFIGISPVTNYYPPNSPLYSTAFPFYFSEFLYWLELLSLSIGLMNMLPVPFFDGGAVANILARFLLRSDKRGDQVSSVLLWCSLAILVLNVALSFYLFPNFKLG
jgi:membrane-associated protease RseP (regulator of RpoE activity)